MLRDISYKMLLLLLLLGGIPVVAQKAASDSAVPRLVNYSGKTLDNLGKPLAGVSTVTFNLYKEEEGGPSLWTETQNIQADEEGKYTVQLGATEPAGLALGLFNSGEARWLGVRVNGGEERPRVLLLSVPYALKAVDAETLGGLPASAFVLASARTEGTSAAASTLATAANAGGVSTDTVQPNTVTNVTTTGGTSGYVPLFNGTSSVVNSVIYNTGAQVGIGRVPTAGAILDVNGAMVMRGKMTVSRTGNATSSQAYPSYGFDFFSNAYNSSTHKTDNPYFQIQSEPSGNNTSETGATFNLLYSNSGLPLLETGFSVNPAGQVLVGGGNALGNGDGQLVVNSPTGQTSLVANGRSAANEIGGIAFMAIGGSGEGNSNNGGAAAQFFGGTAAGSGTGGDGLDAYGNGSSGAYAGYFGGNVEITGTLNGQTPQVKMDDPMDPANKSLVHATVASSERMNLYSGNVVTDDLGLATVTLPDWFETLNTDFRYQLTVIGRFAQAIVSKEISGHKFVVMTNASHVKVSWQVTAVRHDAYAKANPLVVEQEKPAAERGFYMHPELYEQPEEKQTAWARNPQAMHRAKAMRDAQKASLANR